MLKHGKLGYSKCKKHTYKTKALYDYIYCKNKFKCFPCFPLMNV